MEKKLKRLLLSVTSYCNLRCKYCYVFNGNIKAPVLQTMTPRILQSRIKEVFNNYSSVDFVQFFGGEPNLALPIMKIGIDEIKKNCTRRGIPFPEFGIITNLTLLNDEILNFYKDNHFKVTISIDGPETIHDALRKHRFGIGGTHNKIINNIERLKNKEIPFSVEATFTKTHIEKGITITDLLKYFAGLKAKRADIVCVMANPDSQLDVYGADYQRVIRFFTEAVDYWFDYWRRGGQMMFGVAGEIIGAIMSQERFYCPAGESYLAIAPDGGVYPCHLFIGNKKYEIGGVSASKLISGRKKTLKNNEACDKCNIKSICFSCLGRNEFYCKTWEKPYEQDCILKRAVAGKVFENLESGMSSCDKEFKFE